MILSRVIKLQLYNCVYCACSEVCQLHVDAAALTWGGFFTWKFEMSCQRLETLFYAYTFTNWEIYGVFTEFSTCPYLE